MRNMTHFNGTFVIGMMAMNMIMQIDNICEYSSVRRILAVTSSRTSSPNMIQPTMAIVQSREY